VHPRRPRCFLAIPNLHNIGAEAAHRRTARSASCADLTQDGFPTNPSKRAVCLTDTVVLQAVIAWENAGELIEGVHYPTRGSSEWLPFIARAAIVNVDVALPRVLACKDS
jgi:hypothetical protein